MGYLHGASIEISNISIVAQKFPKLRHLELDSLSYILGDGTGVDPFPDLGISDATADEY